MGKMTKNPLSDLRKARAARALAETKQARIDALPERERKRREAQRLERERIRKERIEREEEEARERREQLRAEEEALTKREEEKYKNHQREAVQAIRDESIKESLQKQPKPSKKRVPSNEGNEENVSSFFEASPRFHIDSLQSLVQNDIVVDGSKIPTLDDVLNMASYRIFYSSFSDAGAGLVGEGSSPWCRPTGLEWTSFLKSFNSILMAPTLRRKLNPWHGEYNYVVPAKELAKHVPLVPVLLDTNGDVIDQNQYVFRVTRPDRGDDDDDEDEDDDEDNQKSKDSPCSRYREYHEICAEMKFVLEAAACGFGVPCYAAFAFQTNTAIIRSGKRIGLWGAVYALKRGEKNLNSLIFDRTEHALSEQHGHSDFQQAMKRGVASFCRKKLLPVLVRQSQQRVLNFDIKPGNIMVLKNQSIYVVDFDSSLYSSNLSFMTFESSLLVNLLLLCVHVRAWTQPDFASAFVDTYRNLILELVVYSRSCSWLSEAKVDSGAKFKAFNANTDEKCKSKLESVVNSYFISRHDTAMFKLNPNLVNGKPLLSQLIKFALTGSSVSRERCILQVVGEV